MFTNEHDTLSYVKKYRMCTNVHDTEIYLKEYKMFTNVHGTESGTHRGKYQCWGVSVCFPYDRKLNFTSTTNLYKVVLCNLIKV